MQLKIGKHIIKYYWDDNNERYLTDYSIETIAGAINKGYTKGQLIQDRVLCNWEDTTDDDMITFGLTQGWFN